MKKVLLALVLSGFLVPATAAILTVSNSPLGGAQFSNLDAAITAATAGDTLLIEGTNIGYGISALSVFNKPLVFIGSGLNTAKAQHKQTILTTVGPWYFEIPSSAAGSRFYGIVFNGYTQLVGPSTNNLHFENCMFNSTFNFNGHATHGTTFINCIFNADAGANMQLWSSTSQITGTLFSNCIFDGYIDGGNNPYSSIFIDHCIFLSPNSGFANLYYANISNSIFVNAFPSGTFSSSFNNNICQVAGTLPPASGGNTGTNNLSATDPLFVSYTPPVYWSPYHSFAYDYRLQASSPGKGAGTDGTDIGVFGGTTAFSITGEAPNAPVVRSMNINNTIIPTNGTLNVSVQASKPRNN